MIISSLRAERGNLLICDQYHKDCFVPRNDEEKIIIDAKFYRETMTLNYDKERIKSANLYQLFSYLLNQQGINVKTHNATGILLYPTIETDYNLNFKYNEHKIQIRTINLNSNWRNISSRLKEIIEVNKKPLLS